VPKNTAWCLGQGFLGGSRVSRAGLLGVDLVVNGSLVVAVAEGMALADGVWSALVVAAILVTRLGAQGSAPHRAGSRTCGVGGPEVMMRKTDGGGVVVTPSERWDYVQQGGR